MSSLRHLGVFLFIATVILYMSVLCQAEEVVRQKRAAIGTPNPPQQPLDNHANVPVGVGAAAAVDGQPKNVVGGSRVKKGGQIKIAESPECAADVKSFCSDRMSSNNFFVLDCLQDDEKTADKLSGECHHFLWVYKRNLTQNIKFDRASSEACESELNGVPECNNLPEGKGQKIPCLIENADEKFSKPCKAFLNKMASIIFSDFRFMDFFIKDCNEDIEKLQCGRIGTEMTEEDDYPNHQGKTITCLNSKRKELKKACKKALLKVAELQSDDYHKDRPLYYACRRDREELCPKVVSGNGAVFQCLFKLIGDDRLTDECREKLEERQKMVAEDVKVDMTFYDACKDDIKINDCGHGRPDDELSRSSILLCLEKAQNSGGKVKKECLTEMFELRSEMMLDYKISPELVSACQNEILNLCNDLKPGGETIHCLMKAAMSEIGKKDDSVFSSKCYAEIRNLLTVANPGENIKLDRPLQTACGDVVIQACGDIRSGPGDLIACLADNIDHEAMTDECEDHLLALEYFAARDFRLDFHLYKQCRKDAQNLCNSDGFTDPTKMSVEDGPMIFACLHRHLVSEDRNDQKPSRPCIHEIKRVMRERSRRINLMPEVEAVCLQDLADLCSSNEEYEDEGGEMECLQMNLEDLRPGCKSVVANFTVEESADIEMDRALMTACTPMIKKFCNDLLDTDAMPDEVLTCLIQHKHNIDMNEKCAVGINHHQIISLKDFRFNHKFQDACQDSVQRLCKRKRTKFDVASCLSEHVRNDTLMDKPQRVDERCMRQLRAELLQRGESIKLDPQLEESCHDDIAKLCGKIEAGEGEVIECLRSHQKRLGDKCHKLLFKRERDEALFGDYTVMHVCKKMIKEYCPHTTDEVSVMRCLIKHKMDDDFDAKCRQVVRRRQVEQARDIRMNPHLQKACKDDIPKFCNKLFNLDSEDEDMEGKVLECLKETYASNKKHLSRDCEQEVKSRIKEAALDINLNPMLMKDCKRDIKNFCRDEIANIKQMAVEDDSDVGYETFGRGAVVECLKRNFGKLEDGNCKKEIAMMIAESRVDVHVDPILYTACQKDVLIRCADIAQGQGRQMSCLLAHLEHDPNTLTRACAQMLKSRKDLWEHAAMVAPAESFGEIYSEISASPARNYFFAILFTVVGVIFIVGITCGRVTKRVRAEVKNK